MSIEHFLARCEEDGDCMVWPGANSNGQPVGWYQGERVRLRTLIFKLSGQRLRPGNLVTTKCKCKLCINPEHVTQATVSQVRAASQKNRGAHSIAKMAIAKRKSSPLNGKKEEIMARIAAGEKQADIAASFGVSQAAVSLMWLGKTWRPLGGLW
jgi:hypothetical protein